MAAGAERLGLDALAVLVQHAHGGVAADVEVVRARLLPPRTEVKENDWRARRQASRSVATGSEDKDMGEEEDRTTTEERIWHCARFTHQEREHFYCRGGWGWGRPYSGRHRAPAAQPPLQMAL